MILNMEERIKQQQQEENIDGALKMAFGENSTLVEDPELRAYAKKLEEEFRAQHEAEEAEMRRKSGEEIDDILVKKENLAEAFKYLDELSIQGRRNEAMALIMFANKCGLLEAYDKYECRIFLMKDKRDEEFINKIEANFKTIFESNQ